MADKFCEYCGAEMQTDDLFCPLCGQKPSDNQTIAGESPSDAIPAQAQQASIQLQPQYRPVPCGQPEQAFAPLPPVSSVQQAYSYQPPPPNNPFTRFSGEMNTGEPQNRTAGRGLVLGGMVAMAITALVVSGIILAVHKPAGSKPVDPDAMAHTANAFAAKPDVLPALPKISNAKKDVTLTEIVGEWAGEMRFVRMDGFDSLPAEELPPDAKAQIAQAMAAPSIAQIMIEEDGNWTLNVNLMEGMQFESRDYEGFPNNATPTVIQVLKEGCFEVAIDGQEDGAIMQLKFNGVVSEESDGLLLQGVFILAAKRGNMDAVMEGHYTVRPAE